MSPPVWCSSPRNQLIGSSTVFGFSALKNPIILRCHCRTDPSGSLTHFESYSCNWSPFASFFAESGSIVCDIPTPRQVYSSRPSLHRLTKSKILLCQPIMRKVNCGEFARLELVSHPLGRRYYTPGVIFPQSREIMNAQFTTETQEVTCIRKKQENTIIKTGKGEKTKTKKHFRPGFRPPKEFLRTKDA